MGLVCYPCARAQGRTRPYESQWGACGHAPRPVLTVRHYGRQPLGSFGFTLTRGVGTLAPASVRDRTLGRCDGALV